MGPQPAQAPPRCKVPNVTAHPSTASVPITILLCDGPLLCGFNVLIKGLNTLKIDRDGQFKPWHMYDMIRVRTLLRVLYKFFLSRSYPDPSAI